MATVSDSLPATGDANPPAEGQKPRRKSTSHLKLVPPTKLLREQMRSECRQVAARLDKARPLSKDEMEKVVRQYLADHGHPEGYLGWAMVIMATEFWRDQVAAVPHSRRLFLMPHCLKHAEGCPADYDEFGLDCKKCGACSIADFRGEAEEKGYKVLVSEGTPIVLKIIVSGHVDAIVGVACLNVLEKAIDKILAAGIPCMAVPLLSSDCRNTSVDQDWVEEMIRVPHVVPEVQTRSYLHLMRAAADLFAPAELERLAPRVRSQKRLAEQNGAGLSAFDPVAATEALAYDFLSYGGKYLRPFATLAVYDALTGGHGSSSQGPEHLKTTSDAVRRAALAIETFHKASLVHDDIEDDDAFRYGHETMHRKHGVPVAINTGDYLVGLGYRLVSRDAATLGAEATAEILDRLAEAHMKLAEGQGAELVWRDGKAKQLTPLDALKIYALKTSPAFEVALMSGVRLAGPSDAYREKIPAFCRHIGVAFQILNDLTDWKGDDHNKLSAGGDVFGGRPTVLWALALEGLPAAEKAELEALIAGHDRSPRILARVRALYEQAGVFDKAAKLVDKYQERAEAIADEIEPDELRRLLYYLIDTVLDRGTALPEPPAPPPVVSLSLPIATRGK